MFSTDSQTDLDEWVTAIREAVKEDKMKMRKFKTQSLLVSKPLNSATTQSEAPGEAGAEKMVKNSLYEPTLSGRWPHCSNNLLLLVMSNIVPLPLVMNLAFVASTFPSSQEHTG